MSETQLMYNPAQNSVPAASSVAQSESALGKQGKNLHETNSMSDRVMQVPALSLVQRKCAHCEEEQLQRKPLVSFIQKKGNESGNGASNSVTSQINASKGTGNRMDSETQSFMQSRFGADFSDISIHTEKEAVQMSRKLNAKAFTVGNDIYFNEGQYNTHSIEGKHLLAHELAHTLQQGSSNSLHKRTIQRQTARPRRRVLWLHVGFDSGVSANTTTMRNLRASIAAETAALSNCCSARSKACDVDVRVLYDWNQRNKPAPADGDYDSDVTADRNLRDSNIANINTGRTGGIKMLVTSSTLSQTWQGVRIFANANSGSDNLIWNANVAPVETLPHETGHIAGYTAGDIEGGAHSSDPDNIMSRGDIRNAGALPDADWCDKVNALAV